MEINDSEQDCCKISPTSRFMDARNSKQTLIRSPSERIIGCVPVYKWYTIFTFFLKCIHDAGVI